MVSALPSPVELSAQQFLASESTSRPGVAGGRRSVTAWLHLLCTREHFQMSQKDPLECQFHLLTIIFRILSAPGERSLLV